VIVGLQQFCRFRVLDDLRDLVADEIGGGVVGRRVDPVPITPTRWPVKSTGSCGQCPV